MMVNWNAVRVCKIVMYKLSSVDQLEAGRAEIAMCFFFPLFQKFLVFLFPFHTEEKFGPDDLSGSGIQISGLTQQFTSVLCVLLLLAVIQYADSSGGSFWEDCTHGTSISLGKWHCTVWFV